MELMRIWDNRDKRPLNSRVSLLQAARLAFLVGALMLLINGGNAQQILGDAPVMTQGTWGSLYVRIDDGVVTVRARDVSVKDLVTEIARQGDLVLILHEPLDERITIELERLALHKAMDRILRAWNFTLQYVPAETGTGHKGGAHSGRLSVVSRAWGSGSVHDGDAVETSAKRASTSGVLKPVGVHEDVGRTLEVAIGLAALERDDTIAALSLTLTDADPEVRLKAVSELANLGGDEAAVALAVALADEQARVREEAVHALGDIGGETAGQILGQAVTDTEISVREAAIDAFADIGGDESAVALAVALSDKDASVREDAVYALGRIRSKSAGWGLNQALMDQDSKVREAAIDALADIGGDDSAAALAVVLRGKDSSQREQAVHALGQIGGPTAIRLLQQAVEDEQDPALREAVKDTLAGLPSREQ